MINLDNLSMKLESQETESSFAIFDMMTNGSVYQNQNDYEFYMINRQTGIISKLDRFKNLWMKQRGLSFQYMYTSKWRKVNEKI